MQFQRAVEDITIVTLTPLAEAQPVNVRRGRRLRGEAWDDHESLLVVTAREVDRKDHLHQGDATFLAQRGKGFSQDFEFHCEGSTRFAKRGRSSTPQYSEEEEEEPVAADERPLPPVARDCVTRTSDDGAVGDRAVLG